MAKVVQIITTDSSHSHYEPDIIEGDWHATMGCCDAHRTVCGIQLEGDDGYGPSDEREGKVTCPICRNIIEEIQQIKRWR